MNAYSYSKLENYGNSQTCKKSKCSFFTLKSQILVVDIFKCDLNLEKINVDHAWEVEISQEEQKCKKVKMLTFFF